VAGGGRASCAGTDTAEMATLTGDEAEALATRQAALLARFADLPQVTIAAIDGWALGGGLMLAVAQDLRVASDRARFGLPEVTLGLNPAYGIARLLQVVAGGWACELLLTGRTIHASEALRMGLVNRVVAPPTLEASVGALGAAATLQRTWSAGRPRLPTSCAIRSRTRAVTMSAALGPASGKKTANSSPPWRATRSVVRVASMSASATARRTSSPTP